MGTWIGPGHCDGTCTGTWITFGGGGGRGGQAKTFLVRNICHCNFSNSKLFTMKTVGYNKSMKYVNAILGTFAI